MSDDVKKEEIEEEQKTRIDSDNCADIPPKHAGGRPTKYWPELHNSLARAYTMAGLDLSVVAGRLDIALSTLYEWKDKYPEFAEALRAGKQDADSVVEASLFQRATGYDHKAVKIFMPANADEPVYAPYIEHVPPDVTAAKLWLTNRKPKDWKEKIDMAVDSNVTVNTLPDDIIDELSPETKADLAQAYARNLDKRS